MRKTRNVRKAIGILVSIISIALFLNSLHNADVLEEKETTSTQIENMQETKVVKRCGGATEEECLRTRLWLEEQKEKLDQQEEVKQETVQNLTAESNEKEAEVEEKLVNKRVYEVSDDEFWLLCKIVRAEETAKDHKTKQLERISIAASILHRAYDEPTSYYFPDTIYDVLTVKSQYNPVHDGVIMWRPEGKLVPVEDSDIPQGIIDAVELALEGEDPTKAMIEDGALYYYSASYFNSGKADPREKRIRDAIPENEKIQFGDTVFHRVFPNVD